MKKLLAFLLAITCVFSMVGCGGAAQPAAPQAPDQQPAQAPAPEPAGQPAPEAPAPAEGDEPIHIEMVGNSFAIQYCQINVDGARAAVEELGNVTLNYNAPQDGTMLEDQINMINQAIAQRPAALLISCLDSAAIQTQMIKAHEEGIPVIAYDIPFAVETQALVATVATDNGAAAAVAADELMKNSDFVAKIEASTPENPVVISCIAPDVVVNAHQLRCAGFTDRLLELVEAIKPGQVSITGHVNFEKPAQGEPSVIIRTDVSPTLSETDVRNMCQSVISDERLIGAFLVNEAAVSALLSATTDGTDLDRATGKYKNILVAGFDAGSTLKNAVAKQYFYGAVAQDPFQMGYDAITLAIKAHKGEAVSDLGSPALWYNSDNMNDPDVARILYD